MIVRACLQEGATAVGEDLACATWHPRLETDCHPIVLVMSLSYRV